MYNITVCVTGELRLLVEEAAHEYRIEGFIQYCLDDQWRWICIPNSHHMGAVATVACGQLGYSDEGITIVSHIMKTQNHYTVIWRAGAEYITNCTQSSGYNLYALNCEGTEDSLQHCAQVTNTQNCACLAFHGASRQAVHVSKVVCNKGMLPLSVYMLTLIILRHVILYII